MSGGLNPRFDFSAPVPAASELSAVHLIAIGGSGMSGVARMYLSRGVPVSGSDRSDSPTLRALEAEGARVFVGHSAEHVAHLAHPGAAVVISGAVPESNPELAAARAAGLPVLHRAQAIAGLLHERPVVAVAGANGKTTTSALTTAALLATGVDPGFVLGSPLAFTDPPTNAAPGAPGGPVVVEADESDGSFLTYHPSVAIVTNVQPDHLDFYGDLATLERAYADFAATIRPGGLLITYADDPGAARLAEHARASGLRVVTWGSGTDAPADVVISQVRSRGLLASATLTFTTDLGPTAPPPGTVLQVQVPMPGEHNAHNGVAALLAATVGLGLPIDPVRAGLAGFAGVHRRFERIGAAAGVEVVDDYAHNAPKVAAAVAAARSAAEGRRVVVAFQPHMFSRVAEFAAGFAAGLAAADVVLLLPVYGAREAAGDFPGITSQLIADLIPEGTQVQVLTERTAATAALQELVEPGDLVVTVGAGDITTLGPELLERLAGTNG